MRTSINATIQFGLATVPVGVASALTSTNDPSFNLLHEKCHQPVKKPAGGGGAATNGSGYYCETCQEAVEQTVHGYEYTKGEYVWFTEAEMAHVKPERQPVIELRKFVKASTIKPVMIEKHYFLTPSKMPALASPYGQLYAALAKSKVAGVGTQTLWGKEHPCAVVADQNYGSVLMMLTLVLYEDLVKPDFEAPIPSLESRRLAQEMVASLIDVFEPEKDLVSVSRKRVQDAITAKVEGGEVTAVAPQTLREPVMDIGEALKQEIASRRKAAAKPKKAAAKPRAKKS